MADGQTGGTAGVATVGEHGDLFADALALDEGGRVQHFLHARAALRTLVTNHKRHARLQGVVQNDLDGLLLGVDHQSRSAELPDLRRHTGGLDHAAVGGQIAAQHSETAFVDLRVVDVVDGAVDTVGVERIKQSGVRPRLRGDDVARSGLVHLLGFLCAGGAHDVPISQLGFQRRVVDGVHVGVQLARALEFAEDAGDTAGTVHIGDLPLAGGAGLADARHGVRDALDVVQGEVHIGGLGHGENVQHGVGGTTHGHIHGHGVLEGFLGGDGARQHGIVGIVVVLVGDLDDLLGGTLEQVLAVGVGGEDGAVAGQGQADGLGQAVHRVGGEHAGAGAAGRADGLLIVEQFLIGDAVVGGGVHHVDKVGALDGAVGEHRGAGLHRTTGDEHGRDVEAQGGHQHARHDLVAVRDADECVGTVRVALVFDGVGDDVAGGQGVEHAGVTHGDAVVHGHRVELARDAASFLDSLGNDAADLVEVDVAGQELIERVGDGDDGLLAHVVSADARSTVEGSGACKDAP